ncbi:hypothetical protein [Kitasatospora phosalacinea]|uniref:Uncharacterized protein n=1 Tax=Kitasatospora phosalacinea TaxID=2065 RepID=A0A9W6UT28_9ACTN|nr:hypothetical protein [Kitasatospora phosalacinea]GLW58170.1 hypothetical protein Kpho01_61810 [Kitasatospora phosalacinea]
MTGTHRPAATFGWDYDYGEFAIVPGGGDPLVRLVLDHCGFERRIEPLGAWAIAPGADEHEQIAAASVAVDLLIVAGHRVANWHEPRQRTADVARHYRWLRSTEPFPDAAAVARAASAEARARLEAGAVGAHWRTLTEDVARGRLRVEARRTLGGVEYMLATPAQEPDHYLGLAHHPHEGVLGITDDYARWYAGRARRDFRVHTLRETVPPKPARAPAPAPAPAAVPVQLPVHLAQRPVHPAVAALDARRR